MTLFRKILVSNRGEIALRVIRACRELGIGCVAVYSDADRDALHVSAADEAYRLGPPPANLSYLNAERIMEVARESRCDALHPGYGFFAENADFARRCIRNGLTFIGPSPDVIEAMGGKLAARKAAIAAGIPIVPGVTKAVTSSDDARKLGRKFGYPIAIKAAAGGGGKGLRIAQNDKEVPRAFEFAAKEASAYFKDGTLYVEKYLARPKHVEIQILADKHGKVVHLGERDCSMQRRHQKLVEETPANIDETTRRALLSAAVKLARSIGYDSAGTIECLVEDDAFYFLEMNTRIQVEHTVTEMAWGIDLVKAQIRIAAGERLGFAQKDLSPRGHAIECRINAESPAQSFRPSAGRLECYGEPGGPGVRVDAGVYAGYVIPEEYDSLFGKLVVWGQDREEARRRMLRALREYRVEGVDTTIAFLQMLLADGEFVSGRYATPSVDTFYRRHADEIAAAYPARPADARMTATPVSTLTVEVNDKRFVVRVEGDDNPARRQTERRVPKFKPAKRIAADGSAIAAPMHGIVADVRVRPGDVVHDGQVVVVIEAMKMMNEVIAQRSGTIAQLNVAVGQTVESGAPLMTFESSL